MNHIRHFPFSNNKSSKTHHFINDLTSVWWCCSCRLAPSDGAKKSHRIFNSLVSSDFLCPSSPPQEDLNITPIYPHTHGGWGLGGLGETVITVMLVLCWQVTISACSCQDVILKVALINVHFIRFRSICLLSLTFIDEQSSVKQELNLSAHELIWFTQMHFSHLFQLLPP